MTSLHSGQHHHHHLGPSASWHYDDGQSHENGSWPSSSVDFTSIPPAHTHPDLPSEPPGYDEFEFSFPTDLSPSLFSGLPLAFPDSPQSQHLGYGYTLHDEDGTSRPPPRNDVPVYTPFAPQHGLLPPLPPPPPLAAPVDYDVRAALVTSGSQDNAASAPSQPGPLTEARLPHEHELSGPSSSLTRSKRLFEEDERSALEAFFDTLDAAPQRASSAATKRSPSAQAGSRPAKKAKLSVAIETIAHEGRQAKTPGDASASATPTLVHTGDASPADTAVHPELKTGANRRGRPPAAKTREPKVRAPSKAGKAKENLAAVASASSARSKSAEVAAILPGQTDLANAQASPDAGTSAAAAAAAATNSKRSNHIASEQRRRTTIKENYKSLVDLLLAGELRSGISLSSTPGSTIPGEDDDGVDDGADGSTAGSGKRGTSAGAAPGGGRGKGRGRGRKGQDGAGATKSVVLERAADYLRWLERGNTALRREIESLEQTAVH